MFYPSSIIFTTLSLLLCIYFWMVGLPFASLLSKKSKSFLALPIGLSFFACVSIISSAILNIGTIQTINILIICSFLSFFIYIKGKVKIRLNISISSLLILLVCSYLSFIVSSAIYLKINGGDIIYSAPLFDHMKVAIINSIKRDGFPITNPFMMTSDNNSEFHYYYLWYLMAANISIIMRISGWSADIVLTFITAFSSLMVVCALIKETTSGKTHLYFFGIIAIFGGQIMPYVERLSQGRIWDHLSREHSIESWIIQASWVPQHLMAACFVVISSFYIYYIRNQSSLINYITISMLIAAGVGSSTWVGGITFSVISLLLFFYEIFYNKDRRKFILAKWASIAFIAIIISLPLLLNQLNAARPEGISPVGIHIYNSSVAGTHFKNLIYFVFGFIPLYIPSIALGILLSIMPKRDFNNENKNILLLITIGSVLTSMLFRSQIANNDLGWRSILPAVITSAILVPLSIERLKREWVTCISVLVILISIPSSVDFSQSSLKGNFHIHNKSAIDEYLAVTSATSPSDRILINSKRYAENEVFDGGVLPAILVDRNLCFSNLSYAYAFSNQWGGTIDAFWSALTRIYAGKASDDDMNTVKKLHCNKIIVLPGDNIWNNFPYSKYGWVLLDNNRNEKTYGIVK